MERCESLKFDLPWFQRIIANMALFYNIITGESFVSAPSVRNLLPYFRRNADYIITLFVPKTSGKAKFFIVKYSSLWNELLHQLRNLSPSSIAFKKEVRRLITMALLTNLYHPCSPENGVHETGLGS